MAASIRMRTSLLKNLYLPRVSCSLCRQCQSAASSTNVVQSAGNQPGHVTAGNQQGHVNSTDIPRGQINVPKKKKRDSLSILKALSSTVGKDPTGQSYQFMDDPKLIPHGRFILPKKLMLLSKASGKRTARFMVNEYRNTFDHDAAMPHIEAFQPDITEYEHTDATPEALEERISRREVNDAIEVYNRMAEDGIEVNPQLQLSFLELLCVFGCKNPTPFLMAEERVLDNLEFPDDHKPSKIDMDLADDVFQTLPNKTAEAYNWIVRGLLKSGDSRGLLYYKEMKDSKVPVYLGTYNELINHVGMQRDRKWPEIEKYLLEMKKDRVTPNLETFHSVLRAMRYILSGSLVSQVPSVIAEMKVLNIEPTLQTWSLVLSALRPEPDKNGRDSQSYKEGYGILSDILDIIKEIREDIGKAYTDHPTENFLVKAMAECKKYKDTNGAMMLYELKEEMGYRYIITSLEDEFKFYDTLLMLVNRTETPDKIMEIYTKVTPSLHFASNEVLGSLLDNLNLYREYQHVLQLWQDTTISFKYDVKLLLKFLEVFGNEHVPQELGKHFVQAAKKVYDNRIQNSDTEYDDAMLFTNLIIIFLKNGELEYAWEATMYFFTKNLQGFIRHDYLASVLEMCIKDQQVQKIMSFCSLPEHVRATMVKSASKVISDNDSILQECLDAAQLELLEEAFY